MREKLIEVLRTAPFGGEPLDHWWFEEMIANFADHLINNGVTFCDEVEELKATVVNQRKRADTAETFICTMCSECDYEVNDGILTMQKRCCSLLPLECGKFKPRPGWIPVTERLPEPMQHIIAVGRNFPWLESPGPVLDTFVFNPDAYQPWMEHITHWMPMPEPPKEEPKC